VLDVDKMLSAPATAGAEAPPPGTPSPDAPPTDAPEAERWVYLVSLQSGVQAVRESRLAPAELIEAIRNAAHEKGWVTWWEGDGTRAEQIDDVRWIDGADAEALSKLVLARAGVPS